uniref:Uncharacterized protein n=1 Tax=Anguilla anguilla TaxID=7936 RepID=A0A0E9UFT6_ANGAN
MGTFRFFFTLAWNAGIRIIHP